MRAGESVDRAPGQPAASARCGLVVIGSSPAAASRWFARGPGAHWEQTGLESPAVRGASFGDVVHRPDALDHIRTARAVLIIVQRDDDARDAMRAIWRAQEAQARGVIVIEDGAGLPRHRLATGGGLAVLSAGAGPAILAGLLAGMMQDGQRLREMDLQLHAAHVAQHHAGAALARLDDELHLAARLQQEIMPRAVPAIPGLEVAALYQPLWHVSGDIYRVTRLDERRVGVLLADAMGHGVAAAMYTMLIACALVTKEVDGRSYRIVPPCEALERLNATLIRQQQGSESDAVRFASAVYLVVDTQTGEVRGASAGHAGPLRIRPSSVGDESGWWAEASVCGPVVGVFEDAHFEEFSFNLETGDTLVVYSDGVEQAFLDELMALSGRCRGGPAPAHRELLASSLRGAPERPLEGAMAGLGLHLSQRPGSLHRTDDLTVVAVRRA